MWRPFAEGVMSPLPACGHCRGARQWMLVCPPVVAVVRRLVDLRLLLNGGVLAALSSAALSVLLQMVVQNLRVGLLVWCQDVHEGGRSVACSGRRIDGSPAAQRRGQAKRSGRCPSVETLLLK